MTKGFRWFSARVRLTDAIHAFIATPLQPLIIASRKGLGYRRWQRRRTMANTLLNFTGSGISIDKTLSEQIALQILRLAMGDTSGSGSASGGGAGGTGATGGTGAEA